MSNVWDWKSCRGVTWHLVSVNPDPVPGHTISHFTGVLVHLWYIFFLSKINLSQQLPEMILWPQSQVLRDLLVQPSCRILEGERTLSACFILSPQRRFSVFSQENTVSHFATMNMKVVSQLNQKHKIVSCGLMLPWFGIAFKHCVCKPRSVLEMQAAWEPSIISIMSPGLEFCWPSLYISRCVLYPGFPLDLENLEKGVFQQKPGQIFWNLEMYLFWGVAFGICVV